MPISRPTLPPRSGYVEVEVNGVRQYRPLAPVASDGASPEPSPTEAEDTAAMLIDHEYRLTLMELGLSEGGEA